MLRRQFAILLLVPLLFTFRARADDAKTPGQRVFYTGHSFHMFVPARVEQLVKLAGIDGHRLAGAQGIGGSKVYQHWDLADDKNKAKAALKSGDVDVFTMAAHLAIPDRGIASFTELGLQHNPKLRLLVQLSWVPWDVETPEKKIKNNAERDAMVINELEEATNKWRKRIEDQADELNKKHGRRAVDIVPVGNAVVKLRELILAGKYPGVTKQSELFTDAIGHGKGHILALTAYCNFATIYRRSPEGLNLKEPGLTDEQHAILQRIAWETVSMYPYAGVK